MEQEIVFDITFIAITCIVGIFALFAAKIFLGHQGTGSKYLKMKMKEMEDVIEFQKKQVMRYKNKASQMEVAPSFDGDGELTDFLPDIVGQVGDFLPKWAQPFLKDPEMVKYAIEYAGKHPDVAKKWFGKLVGKKSGSEEPKDGKLLGNDVLSL